MKSDESKTFAELAIGESIDNPNVVRCKKTEPIEEYLLKQLSIGIEELTEDKKQLYLKNFTHLMCQIILDLREIDNKLKRYKQEHKIIENDKSNQAEYNRRKLEYFAKINKAAQLEILEFLRDGLKKYLVETDFDTLKREEDNEQLSMMYLNRRYKYAYMRPYYDIEFDYSTCVKVNYFPNVDMYNMMQMEKKYIKMHKNEPDEYYKEIKAMVDSNDLMNAIALGVANNYHLSKRTEIFKELVVLFDNKSYQAFVALGLLQLEGMFYDLCLLKFAEKENQGTLVEKVEKSFSDNEFTFMRYYPYFSFDVPVMRNEIAHKGMVETEGLERVAYDLVLDLNAISCVVRRESYSKFTVFHMINDEMSKEKIEGENPQIIREKIYNKYILELLENQIVANDDFWKMLKRPEDFEDELKFYEKTDLPEGYVDRAGLVCGISKMVWNECFWIELYKVVKEHITPDASPNSLYTFAKRMKNDYIKELNGDARDYCIEIAKILEENKTHA